MAKILYNNKNPFDGISTTPLVSRSSSQVYKGEIESISTSIVLYGRLKYDNICYPKEYVLDSNGNRTKDEFGEYITTARTFSSRMEAFLFARQKIIESFSVNLKTIQILDSNDEVVFEGKHCLVRSITFDEDRYFDLVPYTINIDVFSGNYAELGILDPSDSWSFDDNGNGTSTATHQISCKAINTDSMSLDNAKNFIEQRATPVEGKPTTLLFKNIFDYYLRSKKININRFTGECSLVESYIAKNSGEHESSSGILFYLTDVKQNGKVVNVSISGKIIGSIDDGSDLANIRQVFLSQDWYSIATESYTEGGLSQKPVEFSTREDLDKYEITFSIIYSNQNYSGPYIVDSTTIIKNHEDNSYCVKFKGVIRDDYGCKGVKFEEIKNYYDSLDIEYLFSQKYSEFGDGTKLSNTPKSRSYVENKFDPSISFEVVYCNVKGESCGCFDSFDYVMSFKPAIPKYTAAPTVDGLGCYYIQRLGYDRRATFSISGQVIISDCCSYESALADLKNRLNSIMARNFVGTEKILDSANFTKSTNGKIISFDVSWSARQSCPLPSNLKTC